MRITRISSSRAALLRRTFQRPYFASQLSGCCSENEPSGATVFVHRIWSCATSGASESKPAIQPSVTEVSRRIRMGPLYRCSPVYKTVVQPSEVSPSLDADRVGPGPAEQKLLRVNRLRKLAVADVGAGVKA